MRAALATPVLLVLIASCGGGTPTVAPTVPVASASTSPPTVTADAPVDVSALPPPGGLAVTVHIAHPRVVFEKVTSVLGSLSSLLPWLGNVDLDAAVTAAAGAPIGAAIDLEQPVDLAMSDWNGEGGPKIAGSVGLVASPAARETLERFYKSAETGLGVVRLEPRDDAPEGASPRPCAILPGAGGAARLVCGESDKAVLHLGPYLARTMTRTTSSDDVRVEIFVRELHDSKAASHDDAPKKDKDPGELLADDLVEKLSADVGSVVVEASSRSNALDMKVTSSFASAASALTRATLGLGTPGSPPAVFDRLPREASFAWYGRGASTADLEPLRSALVEAVRQSSIDDGYTPAVTEEMLGPLQRVFLTGGAWAVATGARLDEAKSALDAYVAGGKTTEAARLKARPARTEWFVGGVDEPSEKWMAAARILVKSDDVKPTGKPKRTSDPQKEKWKLAIRPVPAALHLPGGTLHVEAQVTPNPKWAAKRKKDKLSVDASLPHPFHFFVVPDGSRTWLAAAEDPAIAATEVLASIGGAPDTGTLASRHDLDALRGMPASTAGFVSVAGLVAWRGGETDEELHHARESLLGLASLTAAGTTPVPIALAATPGSGGAAQGGDFGMRVVFPLSLGLEIATSGHSIF
jgi:hypothetical protein